MVRNFIAIAALVGSAVLAPDLSAQTQYRALFYNQNSGAAATDVVSNNTTLTDLKAGTAASGWTSVVNTGGGMLFYNKNTGTAVLTSENDDGSMPDVLVQHFAPGWSTIAEHQGYLLFYNKDSGLAAVGTISASGFHQSFWGYFAPGWTHIVSTSNGLLFYNASSGAGALGDWKYKYLAGCTGFCPVPIDVEQYYDKKGYSFAAGWTHIMDTNMGLMFYRSTDGLFVMTDFDNQLNLGDRVTSITHLQPSYTSVAMLNSTEMLFYNSATGAGELGHLVKPSPWVLATAIGTYQQDWAGSGFAPGWTHIVPYVKVFIH